MFQKSNSSTFPITIKSQIANILTTSRIVLSIVLIFVNVLSVPFYLIYIICGTTDMIDGTIARKTHSDSKLGERLDSIADFLFIAVCIAKIFSVVDIPFFIWIWIGVITVIKIVNLILGVLGKNKNIFLHSIANKITGFLCFALPLTMQIIPIKYSSIFLCVVATFAAIQELYLIRKNK